MAVTTPPTISALPTPPSTSDPATFDTRADAFMAALSTHTTETNAASENVYANAVDAASSATASSVSANASASSAATAVSAAGATLWVSGTTYAIGAAVISPANVQTYRRLIGGAGTTDPSIDPVNWRATTVDPVAVIVTGTTQNASANSHYVATNVAATAVTLPASPTTSDVIWFTVGNNLTTNTIDPGANTINGVAGVLTVDDPYATIFFKWDGSTWLLIPLGGYTPSFARPAITGPATVTANSASAALTVTQTGAGNAFVVEDSASTDSTPFVIDASGNLLIGYSTQLSVTGAGSRWQGAGTGQEANVALIRYSDTVGTAPNINLARARGSVVGTNTVVQSGDVLASINFGGGDGSALLAAAQISALVDGTPGTNDMPGRLVFSTTADGASGPTERMRIDSAGIITARIGTAIPAGGTAGFGYCATSTANFGVFFGSGAPTLSAAKGSLYLRSDGSTTNDRMYVNTNGATTWTAVTTAA